jgi:glycosyltransferase involved in cell wall biosynthesis
MKQNKVSVILPVHLLDEKTKPYFNEAVKSVEVQELLPHELIIVASSDESTLDYITKYDYSNLNCDVNIVQNEDKTDFQSQVNLGIKNATGEWGSILEYDDVYSKTWFKNVKAYQDAYPNVEMFLPMIVDVNEQGDFISFSNEAVWATSFSDELGFVDFNCLLNYHIFNIDGMVFKKSLVDEFGGFKSNIKLTFNYEFLLRMSYKDTKIMTIPKLGYKHVAMREGSLFSQYRDTMGIEEGKWWIEKAKKEYFFENDRAINYDK